MDLAAVIEMTRADLVFLAAAAVLVLLCAVAVIFDSLIGWHEPPAATPETACKHETLRATVRNRQN